MKLVFKNKGLIDPLALELFGASSKADSSAIGFFGTGLKYAISVLLREGCSVELFRGTKPAIVFTKKRMKMRNDYFDVILMDGKNLGFTTRLGVNWSVDAAYRELYCNTKDEGGTIRTDDDDAKVKEAGHTVFVVRGACALQAHAGRHSIILESTARLISSGVEIHNGGSKAIFYKGINAQKTKKSSLYTYNIVSNQTLTEDRTLKFSWAADGEIAECILRCEDADVLRDVLTAKDCYYEASIIFHDREHVTPSTVFLDTIASLIAAKTQLSASARQMFSTRNKRIYNERDPQAIVLTPYRVALLTKAVAWANAALTGGETKTKADSISVMSHFTHSAAYRTQGGHIILPEELFNGGVCALARELIKAQVKLNSGADPARLETILVDRLLRASDDEGAFAPSTNKRDTDVEETQDDPDMIF